MYDLPAIPSQHSSTNSTLLPSMASRPTQSASSPQPSSQSTAPSSHPHPPPSINHGPSTLSVDSQTVLIGETSSSDTKDHQDPPTERPQDTSDTTPKAQTSSPPTDSSDPRKCWICFNDETEDTPLSSEWRSPCPCSLTAHESCLLDWIDDLESPSARKRLKTGSKIVCPQCKSEITVARPQNLIVDGVTALERRAARGAIPAVMGVVAGCTWTGCLVYGINTVYVIFGPAMGDRILGLDDYQRLPILGRSEGWLKTINPFMPFGITWSWRLALGLPLIPVALVSSRTKIADSILPILPIIFFATQSNPTERLDLTHWPPSASMSVAALPYLRGLYNELYERIAGPYERKWIKAVQPRHRRGDDGGDGEGPADPEVGQGHVVGEDGVPVNEGGAGVGVEDVLFDMDIQVEILEEDEEPAAEGQGQDHVDGADGEAAVPPPPPPPADADPEAAAAIAAVAAAQAPPPVPAQRANDLVISTSQLADTFIGALLFPTVSGLMGNLLTLILPLSWTTPVMPWDRSGRAKGLLQARWGRSLVGGCLFVVLKDAVTLYVRWKQAQGHKYRRVVDYERKKKKKKTSRRTERGDVRTD